MINMESVCISEVLQVLVSMLDDKEVSYLRSSRVLKVGIDRYRNPRYYQQKVLPLWSWDLPPELYPTDWFGCYREIVHAIPLKSGELEDRAMGWFLTSGQLAVYYHLRVHHLVDVVEVSDDSHSEGESALDSDDLCTIICSIFEGVIMSDDVDKYYEFTRVVCQECTPDIPDSSQQEQQRAWADICECMAIDKLVLKSDGGWKIFCSEVLSQRKWMTGRDLSWTFNQAAKSADIGRYLLLKHVRELDIDEDQMLRNVLKYSPQNISVYYRDFPKEVGKEIKKLVTEEGLWWLVKSRSTTHSRAFMRVLVPYLKWSAKNIAAVQYYHQEPRLAEYVLGLITS
jgi:hypothetical protein